MLLAASEITAQEHPVTLTGIVFDSITGHALSDVAIHVDQTLQPARTATRVASLTLLRNRAPFPRFTVTLKATACTDHTRRWPFAL